MSAKPYQDKSVIVTGASSGIGRALALRLADQGAWIALAARDAQRLDVLAAECRQRGGKAIAVPTDITDEAQCKALIERAVAEFGRLDVLINNAGIGAAITLKAAARRKREVLMGPGWLAVWLRMIAPGLVDKITVEMVLKPLVKRAQKAQNKE